MTAKEKEIPIQINVNELVSRISEIVFNNLKIFIEDYFERLIPFYKDIEDTKLNTATLSSLLNSKEMFTEQEFKSCFRDIRKSFGEVFSDGTMHGTIEVTNYNWEKKGADNESHSDASRM